VLDFFLKRCLLLQQNIKISIRLPERSANLFVRPNKGDGLGHPFFNNLPDSFGGIQLRFLREVAEGDAFVGGDLTENVAVQTGNDAQERAFAGSVEAKDADLRAVEEGKRNILQHLPVGRVDFAHPYHREDDLVVTHC
jgi:hypothetical protein